MINGEKMNDIKDTENLHDKAMELADRAYIARIKGDDVSAKEFSRKAFELEVEVANTFENDFSFEPTRSVLYRSAASLANNCGKFLDAERLIAKALSGNPPPAIADELRDLSKRVIRDRRKILGKSVNKKLQKLIDKRRREDKVKFSQTKLAAVLGMSKQNFGTFLNHGIPRLSVERQKVLCDRLGVKVEDYFTNE